MKYPQPLPPLPNSVIDSNGLRGIECGPTGGNGEVQGEQPSHAPGPGPTLRPGQWTKQLVGAGGVWRGRVSAPRPALYRLNLTVITGGGAGLAVLGRAAGPPRYCSVNHEACTVACVAASLLTTGWRWCGGAAGWPAPSTRGSLISQSTTRRGRGRRWGCCSSPTPPPPPCPPAQAGVGGGESVGRARATATKAGQVNTVMFLSGDLQHDMQGRTVVLGCVRCSARVTAATGAASATVRPAGRGPSASTGRGSASCRTAAAGAPVWRVCASAGPVGRGSTASWRTARTPPAAGGGSA